MSGYQIVNLKQNWDIQIIHRNLDSVLWHPERNHSSDNGFTQCTCKWSSQFQRQPEDTGTTVDASKFGILLPQLPSIPQPLLWLQEKSRLKWSEGRNGHRNTAATMLMRREASESRENHTAEDRINKKNAIWVHPATKIVIH